MEAQRLGVSLEEELHWRSLEPNPGQWGRSVRPNGKPSFLRQGPACLPGGHGG